jgi:uncharacterized protein (DUF1330 family)
MNKVKLLAIGFLGGILAVSGINLVNADHHEKPAYIVVSGQSIDPDAMAPYYEAAQPLADAAGIEVLGRSDSISDDQVLEGEWTQPGFVIVEKFSSMQALKDFWYSDEYQEAKKLREGAVKMNFIVAIEGT